jgi:hypothetical protein
MIEINKYQLFTSKENQWKVHRRELNFLLKSFNSARMKRFKESKGDKQKEVISHFVKKKDASKKGIINSGNDFS